MKHCNYCKSIEDIENYELAKADNFIGWDIHHRLETHNSDKEDVVVADITYIDIHNNSSDVLLLHTIVKDVSFDTSDLANQALLL